jgi:hypothetical protein
MLLPPVPLYGVTGTFFQSGFMLIVKAAAGIGLEGLILADDDFDMIDVKVIFFFF